jgi:ketosteroid isomerase-like protein
MTDPDFEATVRRSFAAFNRRDFAEFSTYVTDDIVETYPQSDEQLVGKAQQRAMHEAFPDPPTFTIRRILRGGDLAVIELDEAYPDGSVWKTAFIMELRDGLISSLTGYFGEPFAAPAWRRPFLARDPG